LLFWDWEERCRCTRRLSVEPPKGLGEILKPVHAAGGETALSGTSRLLCFRTLKDLLTNLKLYQLPICPKWYDGFNWPTFGVLNNFGFF